MAKKRIAIIACKNIKGVSGVGAADPVLDDVEGVARVLRIVDERPAWKAEGAFALDAGRPDVLGARPYHGGSRG